MSDRDPATYPPSAPNAFESVPDLDVDATVESEVIDGAASLRSEHAAGVRVVHHHDAAELVCYVTETGQRAQVAVHAEHAVGDEQRSLSARKVREDRASRRDVAVRKHFDRRATQASAVDDARVIQLVGHDDVVATEERSDGTGIRREATLEDDGGFCFLERREPAFELHVDLHRAGDRSHGARADAERRERVERALDEVAGAT